MASTAEPTDQSSLTNDYYPEVTACDKESIRRFGSVYLPVLYCLVFVFGLLGNSLVVWVLITRKKLQSMADVCLLNLAVSDLLFVFFFPFLAHDAADQWTFGSVMCKIIPAVYYIGFFSSIFFITLMSLDRYFAVVHAVIALRLRTPKWGILTSVIVWAISISASMPNFILYQETSEDGYVLCIPVYPEHTETQWKLATHFEINILGLLIPLSIIIYCNSHIIRNLRHCKSKQKVKAFRLILTVMVVFFLFWVPYNVVVFLLTLQNLQILDNCDTMKGLDLALQVTVTISLIHCCLNPVIYAFAGEKFKKYLHEMVHKYLVNVRMCRKCVTVPGFAFDRASSLRTTSTYSSPPNTVL